MPANTALGAGMYSIAVYGGLVLFGMFLLYDTQKIVKRAETHPVYAAQPYDPVNKYGNLFNTKKTRCSSIYTYDRSTFEMLAVIEPTKFNIYLDNFKFLIEVAIFIFPHMSDMGRLKNYYTCLRE